MRKPPLPCVVLFVADIDRVASFYRELGGMHLVASDGDHAVLEAHGFQLVVHRLKGEPQAMRDSQGSVPVREDSFMKLCLPVQSIAAARSRAVGLGGFIKPARDEWQARGFRACDGNDPEGNVMQVRERAD
jgi:catechol 2,3-dioxygenase-like lactoylglutathione lyase family enzyme